MRRTILTLALLACSVAPSIACTNVIITKGASKDGSCMVSYAADSHQLYGELYFKARAFHKKGERLAVTEWDTYRPLGLIDQIPYTYQTMGNMNEKQLIIGETTWGGREDQVNPDGQMDYGSLIYITLQRASTARAAIDTMVALANRYGYPSEGETFSIADKDEAWVMDMVGKGARKGVVWVARRIPDGYICAHANQCRITKFPLHDPENCLYAPDVISFAREMGYFSGTDEQFSFRDAYNPLDFGGARACDSRAWSAFNILSDGTFTFTDANGALVSCSAEEYLPYAMGYDLQGEMPLFIKPSRKIGMKDVADVMRDHYEGTPMDMRADIGAGGNALPYRWRPMGFDVDGEHYVNERAIATQQTGFWFVAQSRGYLPDSIGALIWFGCDDAATSYLTPIYVSSNTVPECLRVGNGDMLTYSATSTFWLCNRVAQACYKMYNYMEPVVRAWADAFETSQSQTCVPAFEQQLLAKYGSEPSERASKKLRAELTAYSVQTAQTQFENWKKLEELLLVKFIDGNIKAQNPDGSFVHSEYNAGTPVKISQPGYTELWKKVVAAQAGEVLKSR